MAAKRSAWGVILPPTSLAVEESVTKGPWPAVILAGTRHLKIAVTSLYSCVFCLKLWKIIKVAYSSDIYPHENKMLLASGEFVRPIEPLTKSFAGGQ